MVMMTSPWSINEPNSFGLGPRVSLGAKRAPLTKGKVRSSYSSVLVLFGVLDSLGLS